MQHHPQPLKRDDVGTVMRSAIVLTLAFGLIGSAVAGSDDRRPPTPTAPPTLDSPDFETVHPGLAPLLREGSQIQNARGTLREHTETATWRFTLTRDDAAPADAPRHEFIMLPNTHLGEMLHVIGSMRDRLVTFQITGEVFVYGGRNYLLASFPPRVVSEHAVSRREGDENPPNDAANTDDDRPRSAAQIMRDLEHATGPVGRSPAAVPRDGDRDRMGRAKDDRLLPENTPVQMRRGRIGRDGGGAWQFIFDADASGRQDPPVTLMPCLLLEQIERYARRAGSNAPVLISGRVFVHQGRNYLLPSVFQIPRERTELQP